MLNVKSLLFAAALVVLAPNAMSQALTTGDVLDKGAKQLDKAELESLLPGSKYSGKSTRGNDRTWTNTEGGRLVGQTFGAFSNQSPRGEGKWSVSDKGQYCVDIAWGSSGQTAEKWCSFVLKGSDEYYLARDPAKRDSTPLAFKLSK